jgi:predicted HAD superfamily Cof-like phosphohydrolase
MDLNVTHERAFNDPARVVAEFHRTFGYPVRDTFPDALDPKEARLRKNLCNEEGREVIEAVQSGVLVDIAKEVTDLEYVVAGTAVQCGLQPDTRVPEAVKYLIDLCCARMQSGLENDDPAKAEVAAAAFMLVIRGLADLYCLPLAALRDAVHVSNMSKVGDDGKPLYRQSDGKSLKGPNYQAPDIRGVLKEYVRVDCFDMHDRTVETVGRPFSAPVTTVLPKTGVRAPLPTPLRPLLDAAE